LDIDPMRTVVAVVEVCVATIATLICYKLLKIFEPRGSNITPGLTMIVVATIMLLLHRREYASYGVFSAGWRLGINLGAVLSAIVLLVDIVEVLVFPAAVGGLSKLPSRWSVALIAIHAGLYASVLCVLSRTAWQRRLAQVPAAMSVLLVGALIATALALALARGAPAGKAITLVASLVFCTAFGEELFFRGYVQSRLNGALGRPWRLLGVSFGPGLLLAAMLFGFIHIFNPSRPLEGHWELSWLWGLSACLGGLLYGYLREMTGSIWTPTIVHATGGVYRGIAQTFLYR
jgi:membrane protease YdiL (CAAX protease family)